MSKRLKPCQHCGDAWVYESDNTYGSGYEYLNHRYRINCTCGHAWKALNNWYKTETEAIREWNKIADRW